MDMVRHVRSALSHPSIRSIELVGSRRRGDPTPLSDWDFFINTEDFEAFARALPDLVSPLRPLAQQWDRLSTDRTYMLIVPGPHKLDLLTNAPNQQEPPWSVGPDTLAAIDAHFWDWMLWLASKQARGQKELVGEELQKLFDYLLRPMGARTVPQDMTSAVACYDRLSRDRQDQFTVAAPGALGSEVRDALARVGISTKGTNQDDG